MTTETFLIIGLGNPGREYRNNRHNIGFSLIDRLAVTLNAQKVSMQSKAIVTSALDGVRKVILAKPQTYMNLSGRSVQGLINFYKLPLDRLLIAHDDLDLPYGTIRLRPGGGPGGQKGMASTIDYLGTDQFPRLRLGIGRPPGRMDPAAYVLQDFSREEVKVLPEILDRAAQAVQSYIQEGLDTAMNRFNGAVFEK
ncbi:MAG: aminoacyl-tRNA hydrolase [Chloroflexi bacterium RBG_16_51_16]|nr:MAG: aminoacyl-tRNA hydrolase [Chloroflexi bacterium RBG_16_51_16]